LELKDRKMTRLEQQLLFNPPKADKPS